jgi:hypothetical protein
VSFSQGHKSDLQGWLSLKLEELLPDSVAGNFQEGGRMLHADPSSLWCKSGYLKRKDGVIHRDRS